ncbi:hypothetical protein [Streptomyces sp. NPDC048155]|uniref:hypothetical protein n=1 Tax=Streptomyces sp. NPDC048155 TaxID=3154818 RepID=UPI0034043FAC
MREGVGQDVGEIGAGAPGVSEEIEHRLVCEEFRRVVPVGGRRAFVGRRDEGAAQGESGGAGLRQGVVGERARPGCGRRGGGKVAGAQDRQFQRVED